MEREVFETVITDLSFASHRHAVAETMLSPRPCCRRDDAGRT